MTDGSGRYSLVFRPAALRSLRKLDRQVAERIRESTQALRDEPRPAGMKMLAGAHGVMRIRVGDYRILFTVDDEQRTVRVIAAGHRSDIYR